MARGSVRRVVLKDGGVRWEAVWDAPVVNGRRHQRTKRFSLKVDAEKYLRTVLSEQLDPSKERLGDYLERWLLSRLEAGEIRPATYYGYLRQSRLRLVSLWAVPLDEVTPRAVQAVLSNAVKDGVTPRTIGTVRAVLHQACGELVRDRVMLVNPTTGIRLPRRAPFKAPTWNGEQVAAFLAATKDDEIHGVIWFTLARTLMRIGEALALRWADVDLVAGTLRVERSVTTGIDGAMTFGPPKSEASRRTIPLGAEIVTALRTEKARQNTRRLLAGEGWRDLDLVFDRGDGAVLRPSGIAAQLKRTIEELGMPLITPHGFRHSGASYLINVLRVPVSIVARLLGHTNIKMTLDIYTHADEAGTRAAVEAWEVAANQ